MNKNEEVRFIVKVRLKTINAQRNLLIEQYLVAVDDKNEKGMFDLNRKIDILDAVVYKLIRIYSCCDVAGEYYKDELNIFSVY